MNEHKTRYNKWKSTNKKYISSYILFELGFEDVEIHCEFQGEFETRRALETKEQYFITLYNDICINERRAFLTDEEKKQYYLLNKDEMKQYQKQYDDLHKNQKKEYNKQRYQTKKELKKLIIN